MPVVTIRLELLEGFGRAMGHGQQRLGLHFEGFGTLRDLQGLTVNCAVFSCKVQLLPCYGVDAALLHVHCN